MLAWALFLSAIVVMAFFPATPAARWLRRNLIEAPTAFLDRQKPAKVIAWTLIIGLALLILVVEPRLAMALAGVGDLTPFVAALVDGSVALEVMVAVWLAVSSGAAKALWRLTVRVSSLISVISRRLVRAARARSSRRANKPSVKPKLPSDEPGFALA